MGCFRFFSLDFGLCPGVVDERGETAEPMGTSGNADIGVVDDDEGDEDRKSAVKGLVGAAGLASWSTI